MSPDQFLLEARDLHFAYGVEEVLRGVSFQLASGEFLALVGPNGSGKSTLLRLLLGLEAPLGGEAKLFDQPAAKLRDHYRIGYVPQRPTISADSPVTVREIVATGRLARSGWFGRQSKQDRIAVEKAIDEVQLAPMADTQLRRLSGGQQQRAFIARALAAEPELLILDEPVAGVDSASQKSFRDSLVHMVEDHQVGVLLVSHELGAVGDDLDRIVVLRQGSVVFDGTPQELMQRGVSLGIHHDDLPMWLEGVES